MDLFYIFLVFLFGICLGSFFNVCIYRIPIGKSIAYPPSACPKCDKQLSSMDLIPVIGFLINRGKCRFCKEKISFRYPLVEILAGALFVLTFLNEGFSVRALFFLVFVSLLIIITFIDIDHRIIPDGLSIIGGVLAVAYLILPVLSSSINDIMLLDSLFGALIGSGSLILIDLIGRVFLKKEAMGMGDVKMMAWVGVFLGVKGVIAALLGAIWIGAIIGVIILVANKKRGIDDSYMPFGPFLAIGSIFSLFYGKNIMDWYLSLM